MEHFWQTIQGWMDFTDLYAQQVARVPKVGAHFVEVGSFMGASAAFMAVEIANSGKSIQFDTCDTFRGIERANVPNDAEWAAYQRAMSQVGGRGAGRGQLETRGGAPGGVRRARIRPRHRGDRVLQHRAHGLVRVVDPPRTSRLREGSPVRWLLVEWSMGD